MFDIVGRFRPFTGVPYNEFLNQLPPTLRRNCFLLAKKLELFRSVKQIKNLGMLKIVKICQIVEIKFILLDIQGGA